MAVDEDGRDRITSPSINFPQSEAEAAMALVHRVRHSLFEHAAGGPPVLGRTYTTDAGLGTTRREDQASWLNRQQDVIRVALEDVLDRFEAQIATEYEKTS